MYIRTKDEALQYLAEILEIPERREQILQSTICTLLCLEVEPRLLLADCQSLLIEGGLATLRARRRDVVASAKDLPLAVVDPIEGLLFEEIASSLDAIRFADTIRQVFPELRSDRWQLARTLLLNEAGVRRQIIDAVRARGNPPLQTAAREGLERMIARLRPEWSDRLGTLRTACLETLKGRLEIEPDRLHEEAERLFELFAVSDHRASDLLKVIDVDTALASEHIARCRELADVARALQGDAPPPPPGQIRDVA